jgi:peptide/nickel transport system permease protein
MIRFIIRRLLQGVIVFLGVAAITFVIARVVPSDPAAQWVGARATPAQLAAAARELSLDRPLYVQFATYMRALFQGDLGHSLRTHQPILRELTAYLPATIELVVVAMAIGLAVGLPLGVVSAKHKDKIPDHLSRFLAVFSVSAPPFWIALVLQLVFFRWLGLLPSGGQLDTILRVTSDVPHITGFIFLDTLITGNFAQFGNASLHIVMPAIALSLYPIGMTARMIRSSLLEVLGEDYIVAARSYGLSERTVMWRYALQNSLGPTITVFALSIGFTLVNTFVVETIFNWPGIGSYMATSVVTLDFPAIMGITLFSAFAYVLLNLAADILIARDPRVRS